MQRSCVSEPPILLLYFIVMFFLVRLMSLAQTTAFGCKMIQYPIKTNASGIILRIKTMALWLG